MVYDFADNRSIDEIVHRFLPPRRTGIIAVRIFTADPSITVVLNEFTADITAVLAAPTHSVFLAIKVLGSAGIASISGIPPPLRVRRNMCFSNHIFLRKNQENVT